MTEEIILQEHKVKDGVYIPISPADSRWPKKPDEPVLKPQRIFDVRIDESYPFLDKSFKLRFMRTIIYFAIFTAVFFLQWLRYGLKIRGKKNIRKNKKLFKNGALTVCNHVYRWDFLAVVQAVRKSLWYPVLAEQVRGKDTVLIRSTGGIPVAENFSGMKKFYATFDILHSKKKWIHVFPEACNWHWYEPLRPFKRGAFEFARRYNIPVIPFAISYRPRTGFRKFFDKNCPLVTLNVGEPILPNEELRSKQDVRRMRSEAFEQMRKMAGIEQNMWPCEGD